MVHGGPQLSSSPDTSSEILQSVPLCLQSMSQKLTVTFGQESRAAPQISSSLTRMKRSSRIIWTHSDERLRLFAQPPSNKGWARWMGSTGMYFITRKALNKTNHLEDTVISVAVHMQWKLSCKATMCCWFLCSIWSPLTYIHIIDIQHVNALFSLGTNFNLLAAKQRKVRKFPPVSMICTRQAAPLIMCPGSNARCSCHATPQQSLHYFATLSVGDADGGGEGGVVHPSNLCSAGCTPTNYDYSGERNTRRQLHC